uniref:Uncharacterized protein n=1 Tax=Candidatus Methanogaster sp. ANME-2c ERB4 TaxID=2759911 RepID=A0A7G9YKB0_9EURY|nr:hypothetical protein BMBEPEAL_00008 [Methanosarcinales archaeon ANME-2c ERB4]
MHSPIWNDFGIWESDLFSTLPLYSDEAIIQVSEDGNTYYSVKDVWTEESTANFFDAYPKRLGAKKFEKALIGRDIRGDFKLILDFK